MSSSVKQAVGTAFLLDFSHGRVYNVFIKLEREEKYEELIK